MPLNYILFRLYILYIQDIICTLCIGVYYLSNIRIHDSPQAAPTGTHPTRSAPTQHTKPKHKRAPHKRHISPPILIPSQPSTRRTTELYTVVQLPPHTFIYKYPRYILYILKIYNICVYIMCIYISIGIYKISAAKKRANRTQKEYRHIAKARSRAIPQRRERTPPREARTQQHQTQHAADCRIILIQFFRRGVSPIRACSRFREHLRDFASFQKLHKNRRQRSRGRLALVISVIMTRVSARPPTCKTARGLDFSRFSGGSPILPLIHFLLPTIPASIPSPYFKIEFKISKGSPGKTAIYRPNPPVQL